MGALHPRPQGRGILTKQSKTVFYPPGEPLVKRQVKHGTLEYWIDGIKPEEWIIGIVEYRGTKNTGIPAFH